MNALRLAAFHCTHAVLASLLIADVQAGLYADGTTSEQTLAFGAPFAGRALAFRILVPGVGTGVRNTSASFLNSRHALTAAHNVTDLLPYNPTYEVADGTNYNTARGNVMSVVSVLRHPSLDLAVLRFAAPFTPVPDQRIGTAEVGDYTIAAGFGHWGTPATGLPPQDGGLRAWDARVHNAVIGGSAPFQQTTSFGYGNTSGLTLNGRAAGGDSGGTVFNAQGDLIGIMISASSTVAQFGNTTYIRVGEPSIKAWIEENTSLPAGDLPPLSISRTPTGISVSWGETAVGWTLQTSEDLAAWEPVGSTITGAGAYAVPAASGRAFFRLTR